VSLFLGYKVLHSDCIQQPSLAAYTKYRTKIGSIFNIRFRQLTRQYN